MSKFLFAFLLLSFCSVSYAENIHIASPVNFGQVLRQLGDLYQKKMGNVITFETGATGKLYARIKQGEAFDIFLTSDVKLAIQAENEGYAVPDSRFTYAIGKLVLWSLDDRLVRNGAEVLRRGEFNALAIPNPETVAYGAAAKQVMSGLGVLKNIESKFLSAETVGDAKDLVSNRKAELGFTALSMLYASKTAGSVWVVPATLYPALEQQAVLLKTAANKPAALDFLEFLKLPRTKEIIEMHGFTFTH